MTFSTVGGIRCDAVLGDLSDYLDGSLPQARAATIDAHLKGCPQCARFGGEFAQMLSALESHSDAPLDPDIAARLATRLAQDC